MNSMSTVATRRLMTLSRVFFFILPAFACLGNPAQGQQRRRIAVMTFDVGQGIQQKASQQFQIREDLGRKLSDLLIEKLVSDGKFIVIERSALDKILKEQNFSNSDRADPSTAAKIGKIAGVDAIVIGSVTGFGSEEQENKWASALHVGKWNTGALDQKTTIVKVATTGRVVNTSTAEILAAANGLGEASKKQNSARMTRYSTGGLANSNTTKSSFADPMVEEATLQAIDTMAMQLEAAPDLAPRPDAPPPPAPRVAYKGLIADVTGNAIIITIGSKAGVHVGDTIQVTRPLRTVKNPQTGAVLKVVSQNLGEAKVTEADEASATATYSGSAALKVNDHVNSAP